MSRARSIAVSAAFLSTVVLANFATSTFGMIPVGFGLVATAGTYFAGLSFILRDAVQDQGYRRRVAVLILAGAALSAFISPALALASAAAFLLSEFADFAVYTPLRKRGYVRAAIASNIVGALVDTLVFLAIAGFPIWISLPGQMVGKLSVTAATVIAVLVVRFIGARHTNRSVAA